MCPQIGDSIAIQGGYSSSLFEYSYVRIYPCSNSSQFDRPCHPQAVIDQLFHQYINFAVSFHYTNPVISPTKPDYISYYL